MRTVIFVSAGVAGIGLLVGSSASSAVVPPIADIAGAHGAPASRVPGRPGLRNHQPPTPTPCSSNFPTTSFNAIHGAEDHAGGDYSAVLAGADNAACDTSTSVSGGNSNTVGLGASNSFIGGGYVNAVSAPQSGIMAGIQNSVAAYQAGVGAGYNNALYPTAGDSFIAAGSSNNISAGYGSFIGAGFLNQVLGTGAGSPVLGGSFIGAGGAQWATVNEPNPNAGPGNQISGTDSFIGAGNLNRITGNGSIIGAGGSVVASAAKDVPSDQIAGNDSFIGAGDSNSVSANEAFIGSGQGNTIATAATYSFIGGGYGNFLAAAFGTIAGGYGSTVSGSDAAVGGGEENAAIGTAAVVAGGAYSSARGAYATIPGGYENAADGTGSFAAGTLAKARNLGDFVWSDNSTNTELQSTANYQFLARASGGFYLYSNGAATLGVKLAPNSGTWASASDRNMKSDVVPLDDAAVLAKVAALPISEWSYKAEGGVRHVGPMAQDFYAAFRVGEDDLHITSIDEDGVALAAIKALHAENAKMNADNASLHSENAALRDRLAALEQKVDALATTPRLGVPR